MQLYPPYLQEVLTEEGTPHSCPHRVSCSIKYSHWIQFSQYFCRSAPLISFNFDSILQQAYCLSTPIYKSHKTNKATSFGEQRGSHSFILLPEHSASERSLPVPGNCPVLSNTLCSHLVSTLWTALAFGHSTELLSHTQPHCSSRPHAHAALHQLFSICVSALVSSLFLALLLISFAWISLYSLCLTRMLGLQSHTIIKVGKDIKDKLIQSFIVQLMIALY